MLSAAESWNSTVIAEILSASSNPVVLSILWARRYKISNNLISTSKFHKLPELAALVMWAHTAQVIGPPRGEKTFVLRSYSKALNPHTLWPLNSRGNIPRQELLECVSPGHCWAPLEAWHFWTGSFSRNSMFWRQPVGALSTHLFPLEESKLTEKVTEPSWLCTLLLWKFL